MQEVVTLGKEQQNLEMAKQEEDCKRFENMSDTLECFHMFSVMMCARVGKILERLKNHKI